MGINLVTFAAKTVTPQDDALIYETALPGSGFIYGGLVTIKSANVLHVAAGHGALCGRKFTIEATDVPVALTSTGTLLGRLYIHMDLSDTEEPISFQVETANSLTPVIQQDDVNIINGIYEINLATFEVDTSEISNLQNVAPSITPVSPESITVDYTGTASSTGVRYQQVNVGSVHYEVSGSKYMEQTQTLSTSDETTYTFTNAALSADSEITPYSDIYGMIPSSVTTAAGSCTVVLPKHDTAVSCKVRIYIR